MYLFSLRKNQAHSFRNGLSIFLLLLFKLRLEPGTHIRAQNVSPGDKHRQSEEGISRKTIFFSFRQRRKLQKNSSQVLVSLLLAVGFSIGKLCRFSDFHKKLSERLLHLITWFHVRVSLPHSLRGEQIFIPLVFLNRKNTIGCLDNSQLACQHVCQSIIILHIDSPLNSLSNIRSMSPPETSERHLYKTSILYIIIFFS